MIRLRRHSATLAVAGVLCLVASSASAQPGAGGGGRQPDLASLLHLQPGQMGALQAVQAASRPRPDEASAYQAASPQAMGGLRTPQRLDRIAAAMTVERQIFQRQADATRAFYNQLSPDQQKTFDQFTAHPPGGGAPSGG